MTAARDNLLLVLAKVTGYLKTVAYYQRVLDKNVRDLYASRMDEAAFIDDLVRLVDEQFTRAWNEGMRANDLDPAADMTEEWAEILDEAKLAELDYIESFAADIRAAAEAEASIDQFRARAEIWANRYNEIVNLSKITTGGKVKYEWRYGETEHCDTCQSLNGIVAFATEWEQAGIQPQSRLLECGGWNCQCQLETTDKRRTPEALGRIMDIVAGAQI